MRVVVKKVLGSGTTGTVFQAVPLTPGAPRLVAVKTAPFVHVASIEKEARILSALGGCPQIIGCHGTRISTDQYGFPTFSNLVLEYADRGSLEDLIPMRGGMLKEQEIVNITKMILKGLRAVHDKGFVHCDLKPANILLSSTGSVKIADFGLSKEPNEPDKWVPFSFRGTPLYSSPESFASGKITPAMDIWSLGCVVIEMMTGRRPWQGIVNDNNNNNIAGAGAGDGMLGCLMIQLAFGRDPPPMPPFLSDVSKDFLLKCFALDYTQRWTADMLLQHPFLNWDHYNNNNNNNNTPKTNEEIIRKSKLQTSSTAVTQYLDAMMCGSTTVWEAAFGYVNCVTNTRPTTQQCSDDDRREDDKDKFQFLEELMLPQVQQPQFQSPPLPTYDQDEFFRN